MSPVDDPPISGAERIEYAIIGVGAALAGGLVAPPLVDRLAAVSALSGTDRAIVFVTLFLFIGVTLLRLALALRTQLGWLLARWIAIPCGAWRSAAYLARHAAAWGHDPEGGSVLAGALALLHRDAHSPAIAATLEERLHGMMTLSAAGITSAGLLLASRGERDGARELLRSALELDGHPLQRPGKRIARDWLIADAAADGAWPQVFELGASHHHTLSRQSLLLVGVAGRFVGGHSPTDTGLSLRWLLCPRREATRPLVDRARAIPQALHPRTFSKGQDASNPKGSARADNNLPPLPRDPLARALTLHAYCLARDPLYHRYAPEQLLALCEAWDRAVGDGVRSLAEARAAALGIPMKAAAIVDRFEATVIADLVDLVLQTEVPLAARLAAPGTISARVLTTLRDTLLREVEELCEALDRRIIDRQALPGVDEWREWMHLRERYTRAAAIAGAETRYVLFPETHRIACSLAVWLWNDRHERRIANVIFRWLLAEAELIGDEEAIALQRRNLGITQPHLR